MQAKITALLLVTLAACTTPEYTGETTELVTFYGECSQSSVSTLGDVDPACDDGDPCTVDICVRSRGCTNVWDLTCGSPPDADPEPEPTPEPTECPPVPECPTPEPVCAGTGTGIVGQGNADACETDCDCATGHVCIGAAAGSGLCIETCNDDVCDFGVCGGYVNDGNALCSVY